MRRQNRRESSSLMKYQEQLEQLLINNSEINEIFAILRKFHLGQAYLCAGSVRTLVWNSLMQRKTNLKLGNLDIFYNAQFESAEEHQVLTTRLNQSYSKYLWSLNNLSQINPHAGHHQNGQALPDVIAAFPETASAVGVNLDFQGKVSIIAPYGLNDLFEFKLVASPNFLTDSTKLAQFHKRVERKNWLTIWPQLTLA